MITPIDDDDPRPRQPAAVDEGCVRTGVADDEAAAAGERGDGADVGQIAGREDECGGVPRKSASSFSRSVCGRWYRTPSRRRRSGAPLVEGGVRAGDDVGMGAQAQVVVGREIDERRGGIPNVRLAVQTCVGARAIPASTSHARASVCTGLVVIICSLLGQRQESVSRRGRRRDTCTDGGDVVVGAQEGGMV